jgi:hypothetical protein
MTDITIPPEALEAAKQAAHHTLPHPERIEAAVRAALAAWPKADLIPASPVRAETLCLPLTDYPPITESND